MISYPIYEILFLIALLFAPEGTTEFKIAKGSEPQLIFHSTEQGWMNTLKQEIWKEEKNTVVHGSENHDISKFIDGIDDHNWSEESILHLRMMDVLKTKNGLIVYPTGIDYPKNKYSIIYKIEANKSE
jgi:hypothetical protein